MAIKIKPLIILILLINFCFLLIYVERSKIPQTAAISAIHVPEFEDAPSGDWKKSEQWKGYLESLKIQEDSIVVNIKRKKNYCKKVKKYRESHPIEFDSRGLPLFSHRNFYTEYAKGQIPRKALAKHAQLMHEENYELNNESEATELDPSIISFYTHFIGWHKYYSIGKHFLCEGQRYNHIPGNTWLNFKDVAIDNMREYSKYYAGREHCFDPWSIFPFTYNLEHEDQCQAFMSILEKERHSTEIKWILKKSRFSHRGQGIYLLNSELAEAILEGFECPSIDMFLVQKYIKNPFLINNRKFDFRVYMVIASMDPLIILYRDGFIRFSPEEYDSESSERNVHLTNTDITLKSLKHQNITKEEKREIIENQSWSLEELEGFMVSHGYAQKGWLDRDVRKFIKWMMFHLVRMSLDRLLRHPGVYELFGLDFLMDTDLHLWFLETNLQPAMVKGNEMKTNVYYKMMEDLVNIELALQFNADFDAIFETTDFEMIFDGRKSDFSRYHGILTRDCV